MAEPTLHLPRELPPETRGYLAQRLLSTLIVVMLPSV
jgi:hypothetical protein